MEFDQAYTGSMEWNFPSPSATPTTSSFQHNGQLLQTPKTATLPSHFHDAFSTPQMQSYATPQQIQYPSMTPVLRPHTSEDAVRSNFLANMQSGNGQMMLPQTSQPMYNGQRVVMSSPMQAGPAHMSSSPAYNSSFSSSQMQTPPPTRGASTRKLQSSQIAFGTPTTIASNQYSTPQRQTVLKSNAVQPAPAQFTPLQYTSNAYQFANAGQTAIPAQSPSQIFWNQAGSPAIYLQQQQQQEQQPQPPQLIQHHQQQQQPQHLLHSQQIQKPLDDPFAPGPQPSMMWTNGATPNLQTVAFDTPAMVSFPTLEAQPQATFTAGQNVTSAQQLSTSGGVDPSLLYSSPVRPEIRPRSASNLTLPELPSTKRKDSGITNSGQPDTVVTNSNHKPVVTASVRRSNTTSTTRSKSAHFDLSSAELSRSNSISQVPRTVSPLKRVSKVPLGSISELNPSKRASVILTIDENGRARTQTFPRQASPTKSMRERYPGLYDSDSSDDESDISETPSRAASSSFSVTKADERRSKAARLDPPVENLEGLNIPRSTSVASTKGIPPSRAAVAAAAQLRRSGSLRKASSSRSSAARRSFINTSQASLMDSDVNESSSQQQHQTSTGPASGNLEYEKPSARHQNRGLLAPNGESTLDAHNRRWSMMSFEQQSTQPIMPPHQQSYDMSSYHYAGPASNVMHNPPPAASPPLQIRCVCGVPNDQGQPLIRCVSCTQWLHAPCVGMLNQHVPPNFMCFLCTRPPMSR